MAERDRLLSCYWGITQSGVRIPPSPLKTAFDTRSFCISAGTLREGELVRRSPHPPRSGPPSPRGEGQCARFKMGLTFPIERDTFHIAASEALTRSRRGEAQRRQGWVGGVHPSAPITARTQASDGQRASPRAARSAGLRFAVSPLSEAINREITKVRRPGWHLIHRKRSPFPS